MSKESLKNSCIVLRLIKIIVITNVTKKCDEIMNIICLFNAQKGIQIGFPFALYLMNFFHLISNLRNEIQRSGYE